jgi:hypothetical protein
MRLKRLHVVFLLLAAGVFVVSGAMAGTQDQAKLALHAVPHAAKTCGKNDPVTLGIPCSGFNTYADLNTGGKDIYLVVAQAAQGPGVAGLSCGLSFDYGILFSWTNCATLEFRNNGWPASGGGNRITWATSTACQTTVVGSDGVHAVAGVFYMYAYDPGQGTLAITQNLGIVPPELQVADCAATESNLTLGAVGRVAISGNSNDSRRCNPCLEDCLGPIPVRESTWGRLKSQYGDSDQPGDSR